MRTDFRETSGEIPETGYVNRIVKQSKKYVQTNDFDLLFEYFPFLAAILTKIKTGVW